jgi:hypothetical protein
VSDNAPARPDRRQLFALSAGAALIGAALSGRSRAAAAKVAKATVKYQYVPKDTSRCGLCASFIAPPDAGGGPGMCRIVDGPIPQNGWCVLFSPAK